MPFVVSLDICGSANFHATYITRLNSSLFLSRNDNKQLEQVQVTIRMQEHTESWPELERAPGFLLVDRSAGIKSVSRVIREYVIVYMTPICSTQY